MSARNDAKAPAKTIRGTVRTKLTSHRTNAGWASSPPMTRIPPSGAIAGTALYKGAFTVREALAVLRGEA